MYVFEFIKQGWCEELLPKEKKKLSAFGSARLMEKYQKYFTTCKKIMSVKI